MFYKIKLCYSYQITNESFIIDRYKECQLHGEETSINNSQISAS